MVLVIGIFISDVSLLHASRRGDWKLRVLLKQITASEVLGSVELIWYCKF